MKYNYHASQMDLPNQMMFLDDFFRVNNIPGCSGKNTRRSKKNMKKGSKVSVLNQKI